jgi:hypothetical protein
MAAALPRAKEVTTREVASIRFGMYTDEEVSLRLLHNLQVLCHEFKLKRQHAASIHTSWLVQQRQRQWQRQRAWQQRTARSVGSASTAGLGLCR